jgi:hypothetical protein
MMFVLEELGSHGSVDANHKRVRIYPLAWKLAYSRYWMLAVVAVVALLAVLAVLGQPNGFPQDQWLFPKSELCSRCEYYSAEAG